MQQISFGTSGWRATLDLFTTPRVQMVAQATADYLTDEGWAGGTVGICYDARESSRGFAEDVAAVLVENGFDVLMPPRDCPTPMVSHAIVERDLAGALVITASHNPPEYNGIKFFPPDGAPALPEVTEAIEANLREPVALPEAEWGTIEEVDYVESHFAHLFELIDADLDGLSIVYDAMHGSGRGVTDDLLERAGADVTCFRCTQDPEFGGHGPEPSREHLQPLVEAVRQEGADIGIANDGDADRVAIVTPKRGYLDENLYFAAAYDYLLETDSGPAVRSVSTTFLIDRVAEAHDEDVVEVPVGFKWVAKAMADHDGLMGGEESGGFTIRGHVREKDGVLNALLVAAMEAEQPLDDRVDALLAEHGNIYQDKVSVDCPDAEKTRVLDDLETSFPDEIAGRDVESINPADGIKALFEDGSWILIRPSGTEPKMRVYAEGPDENVVETLLDAGRDLIEPLV